MNGLALAQPAGQHDEMLLVAALQRGDEAAFVALVERHSVAMIRVAQAYVRTRAVAEEVV